MINREMFSTYIQAMKDLRTKAETLEEVGLDATNFYDDVYVITDMVITSNFDEIGTDAFFGWFYEMQKTVKDKDATYVIETEDDIWNFLVKHYNYEPVKEISSID